MNSQEQDETLKNVALRKIAKKNLKKEELQKREQKVLENEKTRAKAKENAGTKLFEEKRSEAIKTLVDLGICCYANNSPLMYHGRVNKDGSEWNVNPAYNNTNDTNINKNISGLHTSDKLVAFKFAQVRKAKFENDKNDKNYKSELHKIVAKHEDSVIWNLEFDFSKLSEEDNIKYKNAIADLIVPEAEIVNPSFVCSRIYETVNNILLKHNLNKDSKGIIYTISSGSLEKIVKEIQDSPEYDKAVNFIKGCENLKKDAINELDKAHLKDFVKDIITAYNTKNALLLAPQNVINAKISEKNSSPLYNTNLLLSWLSQNHIIGAQLNVYSATLLGNEDLINAGYEPDRYGRIKIPDAFLLDLRGIETEQTLKARLHYNAQQYGDFAELAKDVVKDKKMKNLLQNGRPEEIMKYICDNSPEIATLMQKSDKNWEDYRIGDHTMTVLRWLDDNYYDILPKDLIPLMKTSILAHDIGKGLEKEKDFYNAESIDKANVENAEKVYDFFKLDQKARKVCKFIVSDALPYMKKYYLGPYKSETESGIKEEKEKCLNALRMQASKLLSQEYGVTDKALSNALCQLCQVMQNCDSGAYTFYAKAYDKGQIHQGGNRKFTKSFDFNKYGVPRLKGDNGENKELERIL